jgi:hypothetical protein
MWPVQLDHFQLAEIPGLVARSGAVLVACRTFGRCEKAAHGGRSSVIEQRQVLNGPGI